MNTYIESELFRDTIIVKMPFPPDPNGSETESGFLIVAGNAEQLRKLDPLKFAKQYYQDIYLQNDAMDRQSQVPVIGQVHLASKFDDIIIKNKIAIGDYVTIQFCELDPIGVKNGFVYFSIPFRALRGKITEKEGAEIFKKYETGEIFIQNISENALSKSLHEDAKKTGKSKDLLNLSGETYSSFN